MYKGLDDPKLRLRLMASPATIRERIRDEMQRDEMQRDEMQRREMQRREMGSPIRIPVADVAYHHVTEVDLPHVRVEVDEINGHVVFCIQPKTVVAPSVFTDQVLRPAFASVLAEQDAGERGFEWSLEGDAQRPEHSWWLVWIHDRELKTDVDQARFLNAIPSAIDALVAELVTSAE